ncbi:hypothetical protein ACIRD2_33500 [Streptomyces sp. NPDC093595]|uniref:hypothetical protein n=1 Tax=Streptomyces sp. NPDC093595 TaxID=3366045 RepID=UPI003820272E
MITRWGRYISGSYPPLPSVLFAGAWAYGVAGLFATVQPADNPWRPDTRTALTAATLFITLLLTRAADDIRDVEYDRRLNPSRPLPRGDVSTRDLMGLCAAGSALALLLNINSQAALPILAAQHGYCLLVLAVHALWRWPSGDKLILSLLVSSPAQLLLHLYIYVTYLGSMSLKPHSQALTALVVVTLASAHLELAKKITRDPRPAERSYVHTFGFTTSVVMALAAPAISAAVLLIQARMSLALIPMSVLPLVIPAAAAWLLRRKESPRWPPLAPPLYLVAALTSYLILGLEA